MTVIAPARTPSLRAASAGCLAGCIAAMACCPALAEDPPAWQVVGTQGLVQVVIVPAAQVRDGPAYKAQIAKLCPPDRTCFVNFYENPAAAQAELPLPESIATQATARFRRSMKNGAEQFEWSCRVVAEPNGTPCF